MIINSGTPDARTVVDYDYNFANGLFLSVTVDESVGDTIVEAPTTTTFHLVAKPSPTDPTTNLPAEDTTVYHAHVVMSQIRTRMLIPTSVEQRDEFKRALLQLSRTVQ